MRKQGPYHAYTDGSVFNGGCNAGAGWVIYGPDGERIHRRHTRRIGEAARATTTLAEIYAATGALNDIAAGRTVILHTDDRDLCELLGHTPRLRERIERHATRLLLRDAYAALYNAITRHDLVTAVPGDARTCPRMRAAHDLAREGAFDAPQCALALPARAAAMAPR